MARSRNSKVDAAPTPAGRTGSAQAGPQQAAGAGSCAEAKPRAETRPRVEKTGPATAPFWRKPLAQMTRSEWEALCDGCGRCCLVKLEDEDTGDIHFTNISCRLLDTGSCRCSDYPRRKAKVPDCVKLTPARVRDISWLPPTCAYRLVDEGRDLPWWHYLVSGSRETVHEAGVSVRGRVAAQEDDVPFSEVLDYIVAWPGKVPRKSLKPGAAEETKSAPEKKSAAKKAR